jgi:hypothetical protein
MRLAVFGFLAVAVGGCTPTPLGPGLDGPIVGTDSASDTGSTADPGLDSDGDGLTDLEEAELGTDPSLADTDADGWDDGVEVAGNTDPNAAADHPYTGGWAIGACRDDLVATGNGVGQVTSDFALTDQFGDTVSLYDFCDREVLLVGAAFW